MYNGLNKSLHDSLGSAHVIVLITLFCNGNTLLLSEKFPQKIIPKLTSLNFQQPFFFTIYMLYIFKSNTVL